MREIAGNYSLGMLGRGQLSEIGLYTKNILVSELSSNIIAQIAYKSRAGNSPGGARKTNQDSFLSVTNILGLEDFSIFAVFDGHGKRFIYINSY